MRKAQRIYAACGAMASAMSADHGNTWTILAASRIPARGRSSSDGTLVVTLRGDEGRSRALVQRYRADA